MEKYYSVISAKTGKAHKEYFNFNFSWNYSWIWNSGQTVSERARYVEASRSPLLY